MICSVLIPSRARFDHLLNTISRFNASVSRVENIEIVVRFDDDDDHSLSRQDELALIPNVKVMVGPQKNGYRSLNEFYDQMADATSGKWVWIMNDDAYILGNRHMSVKNKGLPTYEPCNWTPKKGSTCPYHMGRSPGEWWDLQLEKYSDTGTIVHAELNQRGGSQYYFKPSSPFPIVPNQSWEVLGVLRNPVDAYLNKIAVQLEWNVEFLLGVGVGHDCLKFQTKIA